MLDFDFLSLAALYTAGVASKTELSPSSLDLVKVPTLVDLAATLHGQAFLA